MVSSNLGELICVPHEQSKHKIVFHSVFYSLVSSSTDTPLQFNPDTHTYTPPTPPHTLIHAPTLPTPTHPHPTSNFPILVHAYLMITISIRKSNLACLRNILVNRVFGRLLLSNKTKPTQKVKMSVIALYYLLYYSIALTSVSKGSPF